MNLLQQFQQYISSEKLFQPKDKLLIAVSGGVDSVVLCELCEQSGFDFEIAHCNFQLRGKESDEDEYFVKKLAQKYNTTFFVKKFETEKFASENKSGIQVAARDLRYEWFDELIDQSVNKPINYLLTAHHADDNIETILMNFFKGSGINGLKGILPTRGRIIRPLLFAKKEDLLAFATENKLDYREDSSNCSDKYTRNYFRNQLIPGLEEVFPQVKENIIHNAARFRDINMLYRQAVDTAIKKLVTVKGNELHIPVLKLLKTATLPTILYEIIKDAGFSAHQTEEVIKLLNSGSGKFIRSASHRILHNRKWLIISPLNNTAAGHYIIEENEKEIDFTGGKITAEKTTEQKIVVANNIAMLDASLVKFPLLLRKWKQGDYFYPLGMQKKKKLSRFFIDQKLSLNQKENTWVIESGKKILWIVGMRIDDRFKIANKTREILKLVFIKV
ncbi:MAG: tRNA lysidine(34) synthetase TilS [Ferruginibacter sp.]